MSTRTARASSTSGTPRIAHANSADESRQDGPRASSASPSSPSFIESLEAAARAAASDVPRLDPGDDFAGGLEDELGLVLGQIQRLRAAHHRSQESFADLECQVGSELLGMDAQRWWYGPERMERWRDRQRLNGRLATIAQHRLRSEEEHLRALASLEDRLLSLLHRHRATRDE